MCYVSWRTKRSIKMVVMRTFISTVATEMHGPNIFPAIRALSLVIGLATAYMMLATALSARAETQAAIDAVTLAQADTHSLK
jgi:hypothetical protein